MDFLKVYLVLESKRPQLFLFISEFTKLLEEKSLFIIRWQNGDKLYIDDCNGLNKKAFACLCPEHLIDNKNAVSTINYAISRGVDIDINIKNNQLVFIISSDKNTIKHVKAFKDGLFHPNQD